MLKSFFADIIALLVATFGLHQSPVAIAPTSVARYADTRSAQVAAAADPATADTTVPDSTVTYTVQPGDTVSGLAEKFDIPQSGLLASNNLQKTSLIKVGQKLQIPTTLYFQDLSSKPLIQDVQYSDLSNATSNQNPLYTVATTDYVTPADLANFQKWVVGEIASGTRSEAGTQIPQQIAAGGSGYPFAAASAIDQLSNTAIGAPTITGGSITGAALSGVTGLSASNLSDFAYATSTDFGSIATWGDSITAGTGGVNLSYPSYLSQLTDFYVYNGGVPAQQSPAIAARMIAATNTHNWPTIIWAGFVDVANGVPNSTIEANIASMVAALGSNQHYLILSVENDSSWPSGSASHNQVIALNDYLAATYGSHYLDVRSYLVSQYNPSLPQDVIDHGNDVPPTSLRFDDVHLNAAGNQLVAQYIYQQASTVLGLPTPAPQIITTENLPYFLLQNPSFANVDSQGAYTQEGQRVLGMLAGDSSLYVGWSAGFSAPTTTAAFNNTGVGFQSLYSQTAGTDDTAIGWSSAYDLTNASNDTALGMNALHGNTTGSNNTAVGYGALSNNGSATSSAAFGYDAGFGIGGGYSSQGEALFGNEAGYDLQTGGDYNALFGFQAGLGVTTGARNIFIGPSTISASYNQVTTGSDNIAIGNDVAVASSTVSNQLDIGNLIYGTGLNGTGSTLSTGDIGIGTNSPFTQFTVPGYSTPVEISSISTGLAGPNALYVQGRYAYVADSSNDNLVIFDISNPASPTEVGSVATGGVGLSAIYVQGRYAYVTSQQSPNTLVIIDVSNPAAPVKVSSISTGLNAPISVYVQGRYAYVTSASNHSLVIFDISNPASPVEVSITSSGLTNPDPVYVQGRYAYVGDSGGTGSLDIFDISNPTAPVEVGSVGSLGSHLQSIYVQGRYAYITGFSDILLYVIDISNPASPTEVSSISTGLTHPHSVYVQGRYAYVTNGTGLSDSSLVTFDISTPASPREISSVSTGLDAPVFAYVQGRYAYVASLSNASLVVIDLGGAYIQQLEAGGLETGTLSVRNNLQALDGEFQGGLTVGNNLNVGGSFSLTASTFNATTSAGQNYSIFSINTASSTNPLFTTLNNGNVGIGTSSPDARLTVWGPDTASTSAFVVSNSASTTEFAVYDTGNAVLSGSLTQNSDQRLKTNVQSLDASSSLAAIEALNPVSFDWVNGIFGSGDQLGFIAQAVQDVFPQLVSTTSPTVLTPDGTLGLNYSGLISPIVGAIQGIANITGDFETNLIAWLGNASNGIGHLFAGEVDTQELCVGSTCVTPAQFQAIVAAAGQTGPASGEGSGASADAATSTPDTPPVIQINGTNPAIVDIGATYNDLGATITGPQADLNLGITTYLNGIFDSPLEVDTSQPATDTVDYVVADQNGLTSTSTRTVIIEAVTSTP